MRASSSATRTRRGVVDSAGASDDDPVMGDIVSWPTPRGDRGVVTFDIGTIAV